MEGKLRMKRMAQRKKKKRRNETILNRIEMENGI